MTTYRHTASFGKRQEFVAIAELLKRGLDVYATLVDDQQIDCIIRKEFKGKPVYMDIQIKARSKDCNPWNAGTFAAMQVNKPRPNFFFIFYSEQADSYWIMPSEVLIKEATQNKTGDNAGCYRIMFTNFSEKTEKVSPRPRFEEYRNNFGILLDYTG